MFNERSVGYQNLFSGMFHTYNCEVLHVSVGSAGGAGSVSAVVHAMAAAVVTVPLK